MTIVGRTQGQKSIFWKPLRYVLIHLPLVLLFLCGSSQDWWQATASWNDEVPERCISECPFWSCLIFGPSINQDIDRSLWIQPGSELSYSHTRKLWLDNHPVACTHTHTHTHLEQIQCPNPHPTPRLPDSQTPKFPSPRFPFSGSHHPDPVPCPDAWHSNSYHPEFHCPDQTTRLPSFRPITQTPSHRSNAQTPNTHSAIAHSPIIQILNTQCQSTPIHPIPRPRPRPSSARNTPVLTLGLAGINV